MDSFGKPKGFAFVPVNGLGKPQQAKDKKLIRKHVMRGKNLRIGMRPVPNLGTSTGSPSAGGRDQCGRVNPTSDRHDTEKAVQESVSRVDSGDEQLPSLATQTCVSPFRFYHNLNACTRGLTFDFYTGSSAAICSPGMGIDFDLSNRLWYQWLVQDVTYTHPLLFCISASYSILQHRPLEKTALYHLDKTINNINQRLSDPLQALQNSTVCMIATLALAFSSLGEHATARVHMKGLLQLARLLGGLGAFRHCAKLYTKIAKFDLAFSLQSGEEPIFMVDHLIDLEILKTEFHHILYYSDRVIYFEPSLLSAATAHTATPPQSKHELGHYAQLFTIFGNLQNLANKLNIDPLETLNQLYTIEFQDAIYLLQYQLLSLRRSFTVNNESPLFEALRLAMIAFLTTTFKADSEGPDHVTGHYPYIFLRESLRMSSSQIITPPPASSGGAIQTRNTPQDIIIWIFLAGAMSVFSSEILSLSQSGSLSDDASWLRASWHTVMGKSTMTWDELRGRMKKIAWIDVLHDGIGKRMFEVLKSS